MEKCKTRRPRDSQVITTLSNWVPLMQLNSEQVQGNQDLIINNIWAKNEEMCFWLHYQMCGTKVCPVKGVTKFLITCE